MAAEIPSFGWSWDTPYLMVLLAGLVVAYLTSWRLLAPMREVKAGMGRTDAIAALLH